MPGSSGTTVACATVLDHPGAPWLARMRPLASVAEHRAKPKWMHRFPRREQGQPESTTHRAHRRPLGREKNPAAFVREENAAMVDPALRVPLGSRRHRTDLESRNARALSARPCLRAGTAPGRAHHGGRAACYDESRGLRDAWARNKEDLMARRVATHSQVSAQLSLKLACAYLRDACHHLARLLAHPRIANGRWRVHIRDALAYWWGARAHLHHLAASQTHRGHRASARCRAAGI
jgi:hypothetical protein